MIPLTRPSIDQTDVEAVRRVLESGQLVQGRQVAAFEAAVAEYVGVEHAIAVSSGTAALHLALLATGIGPGDVVLVTAYSWIATANVVELCGARPVFVDIDPTTFNMSPASLAKTWDGLESRGVGDDVRALLPIDAFGLPAQLDALQSFAQERGLDLIEDAACALGASFDGRRCGRWGTAGCFSFHPRKSITTGEGGMVVTSDEELARRIRATRNHGIGAAGGLVGHESPGFNYRMTDFQAALGTVQMGKLDRIVEARRERASRYDSLLADARLSMPVEPDGAYHTYQSYVVLLPAEMAGRRDEIVLEMRRAGIEVSIGTLNMPQSEYFRGKYGHAPEAFPVTSDVSRRSLTLPLYETLTSEDQLQVVEALRGSLARFGQLG